MLYTIYTQIVQEGPQFLTDYLVEKFTERKCSMYPMFNKCRIFPAYLLYEYGQDFLDVQYYK